jgi:hypothetical protein
MEFFLPGKEGEKQKGRRLQNPRLMDVSMHLVNKARHVAALLLLVSAPPGRGSVKASKDPAFVETPTARKAWVQGWGAPARLKGSKPQSNLFALAIADDNDNNE